MNLYRARTRIGAPGNPKAEAGGTLPLSAADAAELIAIDAIDPDPVEVAAVISAGIVSEAHIAPVVRPLDGAPADTTAAKAKPRAPRKAKAK